MPWYSIQENGAEVRRVFVLNDADLSLQMKQGQTSQPSSDPRNLVFAAPAPPTLDDEKAARWDLARAYRDAKASGTCSTPSGIVQINDISMTRINAAVNSALGSKQVGSDFSVDWTMADNSIVTMDADAVIAMGAAVAAFINACQAAGTAIRNQINAATETDALAALDITAGYPS